MKKVFITTCFFTMSLLTGSLFSAAEKQAEVSGFVLTEDDLGYQKYKKKYPDAKFEDYKIIAAFAKIMRSPVSKYSPKVKSFLKRPILEEEENVIATEPHVENEASPVESKKLLVMKSSLQAVGVESSVGARRASRVRKAVSFSFPQRDLQAMVEMEVQKLNLGAHTDGFVSEFANLALTEVQEPKDSSVQD